MAERGLGHDKREGGGREREREEGKVRVRDATTTKFRITTPKKYFSFSTMYSFYPHPIKTNSVFDRIFKTLTMRMDAHLVVE